MIKLFTYGYGGHGNIDDLRKYAKTGALIVDTRLVASSGKPDFSAIELMKALPANYFRIKYFGNVNYQGGPIQLDDPARGLDILREIVRQEKSPSVILLCGCSNPATCHRSAVAQYLIEAGFAGEVTHLRPWNLLEDGEEKKAEQLALF